jgi:PAS domain S-box-containing protein
MEDTQSSPNAENLPGTSAHLFRALIEYAHDVVSAVDDQGRVLYISPATRRYGSDPTALLGKSIWEFLHAEEKEEIRRRFRELVAQPSATIRLDCRVGSEETGWRDKETVMQNLLHEPSVRAIVIVTHDITERKQAERDLRRAHDELEQRVVERTAQLRESEQRYRRLIEGLDVDYVFYSQAVDGTMHYVSPSVKNVLGYDAEDILRTTFQPHITDSPINWSLAASFASALAGDPPQHRECEMRHADGSLRIIEYMDVPVWNEQGRVAAVEGIGRDVTARRRAEEALREANELLEKRVEERTADLKQLNLDLWEEVKNRMQAEEEVKQNELRFRSVVEDQTEFIVRWLPDGTRTFVNSSYCRFVGQTREELLGASFFPLINTEEERRRVRELTQSLTPENPVASYEHQVAFPDGSTRWTQWNDRALFDEDGTLVEFQSVGRDTTSQHESAEKLQRQQEELAHVARLGVMGEMVAAIGHEIGQPLHAISTFASASQRALEANREDTNEKVRQWSTKIQEQVARASQIIRRLRDFTRLSEANPEPFDLNGAIEESLNLVASDLSRNLVRSEARLAPALRPVHADRIQIEQVLVNLFRNACEAMQDTPIDDRLIRIETRYQEDKVTVAVRDRGEGMSDESLRNAFKAFYTTKPEGTGIGLAISRRIIEEYGGQLRVTRNEDSGMTFSFTLPLQSGEGEVDEQ